MIVLAMLLFFVLFVAVAIALIISRRREQRRFSDSVPSLVLRYQVAPDEAALFVGGGTCCVSGVDSTASIDRRSIGSTLHWRACRCCTNGPARSTRSPNRCSSLSCRMRWRSTDRPVEPPSGEQVVGDVDPELGRQRQAVDVDPFVVAMETVTERGCRHVG